MSLGGRRDFVVAIVAAAGASRRMGVDKLMLPLAGRPVLTRTIERILATGVVDRVVVAHRPGAEEQIRSSVLEPYGLTGLVRLVAGGPERQSSVHQALAAVEPEARLIVVHDAARPLAAPALFRSVVAAAAETDGATVAIPVRETLHQAGPDGDIVGTPPRDGLWTAQTPQAFKADRLRAAHAEAVVRGAAFNDDAGMVAAYGGSVRLVPGDPSNIKLTYAADLGLAEAILRRDEAAGSGALRVGFGLDVHPFVTGRPLVLGGVEVPYGRGLEGHSDADVLTHAITDAVLGAAGLRDIGVHFPPGEAETKNASSLRFLDAAALLLAERGLAVDNVDATLLAEEPRLGPYVAGMQVALAQALRVTASQVNIKATTSEGMGFTGRGEGLAAYAVALVRRV